MMTDAKDRQLTLGWFWTTVLRDLDIQFYKPYSRVVDLSEGKPLGA